MMLHTWLRSPGTIYSWNDLVAWQFDKVWLNQTISHRVLGVLWAAVTSSKNGHLPDPIIGGAQYCQPHQYTWEVYHVHQYSMAFFLQIVAERGCSNFLLLLLRSVFQLLTFFGFIFFINIVLWLLPTPLYFGYFRSFYSFF